MIEIGKIVSNEVLQDSYYELKLSLPQISEQTEQGQFVHIKIPNLQDRILRRPFSICNVKDGILTIVYKVVGRGTEALSKAQPGTECDVLGPLGTAFTLPDDETIPVIVAGGYGSAATYILAQRSKRKGYLLLGARTKDDLILIDKFEKLGFKVLISTNDGSVGKKGFVTELIPEVIEKEEGEKLRFYGCGPMPMLMAMGKVVTETNHPAELSLDELMCCGIGACFACVVKVKADNSDGWRFARTCKEGPVFDANDVYYG